MYGFLARTAMKLAKRSYQAYKARMASYGISQAAERPDAQERLPDRLHERQHVATRRTCSRRPARRMQPWYFTASEAP